MTLEEERKRAEQYVREAEQTYRSVVVVMFTSLAIVVDILVFQWIANLGIRFIDASVDGLGISWTCLACALVIGIGMFISMLAVVARINGMNFFE